MFDPKSLSASSTHPSLSPVLPPRVSLLPQPEFPFCFLSQSSSLLFSGSANSSFSPSIMLYRISSRFSEKIMKKNAHSNRICWEYLPCLSPFCFLLFPETFLPGIACSAAWRNINKHYLDSLWKKHCSPPLPCDDKYLPPPDLRLPTFPLAKQALRFSSLLLCFASSVGEKFLLWLFAETLRTHEKQYRELGTAESILPSSQGLVAEV